MPEYVPRRVGVVSGSSREQAGLPISTVDAQIAAICRSHDAACATRNTKDFTQTGVQLLDPWVGLSADSLEMAEADTVGADSRCCRAPWAGLPKSRSGSTL